jgi:hypothetical protein
MRPGPRFRRSKVQECPAVFVFSGGMLRFAAGIQPSDSRGAMGSASERTRPWGTNGRRNMRATMVGWYACGARVRTDCEAPSP